MYLQAVPLVRQLVRRQYQCQLLCISCYATGCPLVRRQYQLSITYHAHNCLQTGPLVFQLGRLHHQFSLTSLPLITPMDCVSHGPAVPLQTVTLSKQHSATSTPTPTPIHHTAHVRTPYSHHGDVNPASAAQFHPEAAPTSRRPPNSLRLLPSTRSGC